ncbi:hypothetical protein ATO8_02660 [Roseivivax marinus]|uniref:HlyD family secretion protein n=1 Tax=Roseivivax marinus TaxID=1379903 RepID=W4HQS0_9RHOB|nr:hypothetical protein [Roseivivax marinus]ETW14773.1 hypothetical protein ATO8_02660 [Roseivivax marinus]
MSQTSPSGTTPPPAGPAPAPHHVGNEYPLLDIPFNAVVDGRRYAGEGLSLVEARLSGLVDRTLDGTEQVVRLVFDFPGFQLVLTPDARVSVEDSASAALYFTDPTGEHHAQLRKVLNDYISGDLTSAGSLIRSGSLAQTKNGKPVAPRRGVMQRLRAGVASVGVLALTAALILMAAALLHTRLFTTDIATPGRVVPQGQTLRATADGQLSYLDTGAAQGEVLYAVDTVGGETLSVAMPCDCVATPVSVAEGSTVLAGEPLVALADAEAPMVIEASLPQELLFEIQRAGTVAVELPDGQSFDARLDSSFRVPGVGSAGDAVAATLVPDVALASEAAGQVAALSVSRDAIAPLAPVLEAGRAAGRQGERLFGAAQAATQPALSAAWGRVSGLWDRNSGETLSSNDIQSGDDQ